MNRRNIIRGIFLLILIISVLVVLLLRDERSDHVREIYERGQTLGNNPNAFSKIGDSITVSRQFLQAIDEGFYTLAEYDDLQSVIERFAGSFGRTSQAAKVGWAASAVLDPALANPEMCLRDESPLVCEYRLHRPVAALIMFGTNDVGYRTAQEYRADLEQIVNISEEMGVIPILSTIPNRPNMSAMVHIFNEVVRDVTDSHHLPLWDYYAALEDLPNEGLSGDDLHPSIAPAGYNGAADFSEQNLVYGYVMRNLTALQLLNDIPQ